MRKWLTGAVATALFFSAGFYAGCNKKDESLLEEMKTYVLTSDICHMQIEVKAANVQILTGEEFYVESNLKYLTVEDDGGCLSVVEGGEEGKRSGKGKVLIYIPAVTLGSVHAETGAGKVEVAYLSTQNLLWTLGAGEAKISELYVQDIAEISGGAGKLTVSSGSIHNLDMTLGVGECNFTGELTGENTLSCGVGQLQLSLRGKETSYCLEIATGLGGATVNGKAVSDGAMIGSGDTFVDISGGIGGVSVNFIGDEEVID